MNREDYDTSTWTSLRSIERWEKKHGDMSEVLFAQCASCEHARDDLGVGIEAGVDFNPRFAESRMQAESILRAQASYMACECGSSAVWIGTLWDFDAKTEAEDAVWTVRYAKEILCVWFALWRRPSRS